MSSEISDEPDRVRQIAGSYFSGQSGMWSAVVEGARVELALGADGRDDCAVFRIRGDVDLVVGSDYVRGPKFLLFELGLMSLYDLGYYLASANLSDIAAMGARPIGLLTVVRYTIEMTDSEFGEVLEGVRDSCAVHGVLNVGGDIGTAERLILSGSALGVCPPGASLTRSGTKAGDLLAISGATGLAGAAMVYFAQRSVHGWSLPDEDEKCLLDSWRRPSAEVPLGVALASNRLATACQDTSDGLKATVEQIAAASGVGITVQEADVPIHPAVQRVADLARIDPMTLVFGGSVDFRLLFTLPTKGLAELDAIGFSKGVHIIGEANSSGEVLLRREDHKLTALPGVAWRHQPVPPDSS